MSSKAQCKRQEDASMSNNLDELEAQHRDICEKIDALNRKKKEIERQIGWIHCPFKRGDIVEETEIGGWRPNPRYRYVLLDAQRANGRLYRFYHYRMMVAQINQGGTLGPRQWMYHKSLKKIGEFDGPLPED